MRRPALFAVLGLTLAGCITTRGGEAPLIEKNNPFFVKAKLDGKGPFLMVLDTGSDGMGLTVDAADRLNLEHWSPEMAEGIGGERLGHNERLGTVEVGEARLTNLWVFVRDINIPGADGILGSTFLHRFRVTVDYSKKRVRFELP